MKKSIIKLGIVLATTPLAIYGTSCSKAIDEITDCLAETSMSSIHVSVLPSDTKVYTFQVSYGGTHTINNVTWHFGDGTEAVTSGNTPITHTYTEGTYQMTATPEITDGDEKCSPVLEKTIVVN